MSASPEKYRHPKFNKLILQKRTGSKFWQCGFHHQGKHHRKSTGEITKSDAEYVAEEWYLDVQAEIRTGIIPPKLKKNVLTVNKASIHAMNEMRMNILNGDNTQKYMDGVVDYLNAHILPFFGDMACEDVTSADWKKFTVELTNKKLSDNKTLSRATLHQARNALNKCLKYALDVEAITLIPKFAIKSQSNKKKMIRVYFKKDEQDILLEALDENVDLQPTDLRKYDARELIDFVKFMLASGLRMDEVVNVQFCDLQYKIDSDGQGYPMIYNIVGKVTNSGTCKPDLRIAPIIQSLRNRIKPVVDDEHIFTVNRYRQRKDMFNEVLVNCGLKFGADGRKRDFISLRHTYICNKIIEGVPVQEIATNSRNSVQVINSNYAKYLDAELLSGVHNVERAEIKEMTDLIAKERVENKNALDELKKVELKRWEILKRHPHLKDATPLHQVDITPPTVSVVSTNHPAIEEAKAKIKAIMDEYGLSMNETEKLINIPDPEYYA